MVNFCVRFSWNLFTYWLLLRKNVFRMKIYICFRWINSTLECSRNKKNYFIFNHFEFALEPISLMKIDGKSQPTKGPTYIYQNAWKSTRNTESIWNFWIAGRQEPRAKGCFIFVYSTKGGGPLNFPGVFTGEGMPRFKKFGCFENCKFWQFENRQLDTNRTIFDDFVAILAKKTWLFLEKH